ncbi:hypothetical protein K1719_036390 [Acacia pycnantha]|nr:hypothetical protein K1719_036390 [Acacia pycnantha]
MNEKDAHNEAAKSEEEDDQMPGRSEGKPGTLKFSADEYAAWCLPWRNSLIIKQWRPNFNPWKADLQCRIAAWIRLPDVPFEFYNVESLRRIGNMIGRMIKVDRSTSVYDKGGFARICVEIDLKQPLLPTYKVFGEERAIVYEGLHQVCFQCGKYGHQKKFCPLNQTEESKQDHAQKHATSEVGGDEGQNQLKSDRYTSSDTIVSGPDNEEECPFGKLKILRRELRSDINARELRKEGNENSKQEVEELSQNKSTNRLCEDVCVKGPLGSTVEIVSMRGGMHENRVEVPISNKEGVVALHHSQENEGLLQHSLDEIMCDQDKAEGELAIPQHPLLFPNELHDLEFQGHRCKKLSCSCS